VRAFIKYCIVFKKSHPAFPLRGGKRSLRCGVKKSLDSRLRGNDKERAGIREGHYLFVYSCQFLMIEGFSHFFQKSIVFYFCFCKFFVKFV